jgi:site-specific DNA-methyltransferase (adenine-specific)/site-specific DNA-methyltransferase (cytosine-N4-specific)
MGSGTTITVANRMKRNSIGIDIVQEYYDLVKSQVSPVEYYVIEPKVDYEITKTPRRSSVRRTKH